MVAQRRIGVSERALCVRRDQDEIIVKHMIVLR